MVLVADSHSFDMQSSRSLRIGATEQFKVFWQDLLNSIMSSMLTEPLWPALQRKGHNKVVEVLLQNSTEITLLEHSL